jgi:hypothetical protein
MLKCSLLTNVSAAEEEGIKLKNSKGIEEIDANFSTIESIQCVTAESDSNNDILVVKAADKFADIAKFFDSFPTSPVKSNKDFLLDSNPFDDFLAQFPKNRVKSRLVLPKPDLNVTEFVPTSVVTTICQEPNIISVPTTTTNNYFLNSQIVTCSNDIAIVQKVPEVCPNSSYIATKENDTEEIVFANFINLED